MNSKKIGFREFTALIIIVIGIKAIDVTPLSLFYHGQNATWMIPLVWLVVLIFPLFFIFKLYKKFPNKCIAELITTILGRYFGLFMNVLLFVLIFVDTAINARSYVSVMNIMIFQRTPRLALLVMLFLICGYIAYLGAQTITKTSHLIFFIFIGSAILLNIIILDNLIPDYLFPISGPGLKKIGTSSITSFTYVIEYIYLGVMFKKVKDYKTYRNSVIVGFVVGLLYMSMMFADYVMIFDYAGPTKMVHVFSQLVRMSKIGIFINNLSAIYYSLWISASIIRLSLYIFVASSLFGYVLRLQEKEHKYLVFPSCVIMLLFSLIPHNIVDTQIRYRDGLIIHMTWPLVIAFPFILWLIAHLKGDFKNEKN